METQTEMIPFSSKSAFKRALPPRGIPSRPLSSAVELTLPTGQHEPVQSGPVTLVRHRGGGPASRSGTGVKAWRPGQAQGRPGEAWLRAVLQEDEVRLPPPFLPERAGVLPQVPRWWVGPGLDLVLGKGGSHPGTELRVPPPCRARPTSEFGGCHLGSNSVLSGLHLSTEGRPRGPQACEQRFSYVFSRGPFTEKESGPHRAEGLESKADAL